MWSSVDSKKKKKKKKAAAAAAGDANGSAGGAARKKVVQLGPEESIIRRNVMKIEAAAGVTRAELQIYGPVIKERVSSGMCFFTFTNDVDAYYACN